MAVNFNKKLWKGLSILLLGQREIMQVTQLREARVGKSARASSLKWLYLEYEGLVPRGLERKNREATSCGISADWEAGARCALVLKYCNLFGEPKGRDLEKQQPDTQAILLKLSNALSPHSPLAT